ncbi:RNA repair transcriptional activator RtcR [Snodgrassella alvi]|uniref:RNA repair transcriptional activator RtcR n=1 Tax=Snodgrassella alvi TaxID=1196083 RepID=UPI000C1E4649|nr:RNA repair transcriptional activator RtcR [Snodgrassella alvi]PIT35507.1 transcriptional regulator [Snodgrassella alvi]PIT36972.1 transcriptional regulator [Snodgrassella alvi]WLT04331.1 RNA repair transcriptional activator RtcR [Snodgrassella alvi]
MDKKNIVFSFLGNVLDQRGKGKKRWTRWRPTIDICNHPEWPIYRLELIYHTQDRKLLEEIILDIKTIAPDTQVNPIPVQIQDPWDFEEVYTCLLDIAKNYTFNNEQKNYYLNITTGTHVMQICWFLLAESRFYPARLLQSSPPARPSASPENFAAEPIANPPLCPSGQINIIDLNLNRYDQILTRFQQYATQATELLKSGIATKNRHYNQLISEIEQVASRSHAPILLCGPTGAGKSFLARQIYRLKLKQHQITGQFVEINCATLSSDNAMSTLFGHIKGAYTGASLGRNGLLRQADNGVLFLDEIGELGLDEQAILLKAIEEKQFYPLGADKLVSSNFQLIAGTNKDLKQAIIRGTFREDLYARINLWSYQLPGLAERKEDIEPNIDFELARFAQEYGTMPRFNQQSRDRYIQFATSAMATWPGNFRELTASITRMATLSIQGNITLEQVENEIRRLQIHWQQVTFSDALIPAEIDEFDRYQLEKVIEVCRKSRTLSEAGRYLFAVSRAQKQRANDADRLKKYLAKFDLSWEQIKDSTSKGN